MHLTRQQRAAEVTRYVTQAFTPSYVYNTIYEMIAEEVKMVDTVSELQRVLTEKLGLTAEQIGDYVCEVTWRYRLQKLLDDLPRYVWQLCTDKNYLRAG